MFDMYSEKNPLVVCLIGVLDGNSVLLVKRKREPLSGHWGLIGGRQTFGKGILNVAEQEVLEETGFTIKNPRINGMYSEMILDENDEIKHHFFFVVVKAEIDKTKGRREDVEDADVEKYRWFSFPIKEDKKHIIPSDRIMLGNFGSDQTTFKEFVMKQERNNLELLRVRE